MPSGDADPTRFRSASIPRVLLQPAILQDSLLLIRGKLGRPILVTYSNPLPLFQFHFLCELFEAQSTGPVLPTTRQRNPVMPFGSNIFPLHRTFLPWNSFDRETLPFL